MMNVAKVFGFLFVLVPIGVVYLWGMAWGFYWVLRAVL